MSGFIREERYFVFKLSHLDFEQAESIDKLLRCLPVVNCVVVERDWPEYEAVWKMIQGRVTNKTTTSENFIKGLNKALSIVDFQIEKEKFLGDIDGYNSLYQARLKIIKVLEEM